MMDLPGHSNIALSLLSVFTGLFVNAPLLSVSTAEDGSPTVIEYKFPAVQIERSNALANGRFPEDFFFGVSTAAYQVEGAWNEHDMDGVALKVLTGALFTAEQFSQDELTYLPQLTGKGESVWDHMTHSTPNLIHGGSNADVSADSYHKYKEDIQLAESIGTRMFGISISWTSILPTGYSDYINDDGVRYYNDVIDDMIENGITPMVTLHRSDLPYSLQQIGGWANPLMPDLFAYYARIVFALFGDRVKYWLTISDPGEICTRAYGSDEMIPGLNQSGIADYLCGHHVLLAHARAYKLYDMEFRDEQNGKIGFEHKYKWFEPLDETSLDDVTAVQHALLWYNDWLLHPIFSSSGDYPQEMIDRIGVRSVLQGLPYSRLPVFSGSDMEDLQGSADFLGLSCDPPTLIKFSETSISGASFDDDAVLKKISSTNLEHNFRWQSDPTILSRVFNRLDNKYALPEIFITKSGYTDAGNILDVNRAIYYHHNIYETLRAMQRSVPIRGYLAWTLIDDFESELGYSQRFGIFHVDFNDESRARSPKLSSKFLSKIYKTRSVPNMEDFLNGTITQDMMSSMLLYSSS